MSVYDESGFRFNFTQAQKSVIHDKAEPHDGNTFWKGVDFRVFEAKREVWIEVKSWSSLRFRDPAERKGAKSRFVKEKMGDEIEKFRDEIVNKFFGTTCYRVWSGIGIPKTVHYVVFLEPPDRGSRPLLLTFQDRLRDEFKNAQAKPWGKRITCKVVDKVEFEREFPNYSVARV